MPNAQKKVLIVDDEDVSLKILSDYLNDGNYSFVEATDGQQALESLELNPDIDAILLDRMMPEMDGIEFLEKIKQDERYKNIPVIMQTALGEADKIVEAASAGASYVMIKPFDEDRFLEILQHTIENA